MRIVFFGTSTFAVPSLNRLLGNPHQLVGVVTQPDRPTGRGRQLVPSPVKERAVAAALPLLQPDNLRETAFLKTVQDLHPHCAVVVAYGRILPLQLIALFPYGAINLHASLLPKYRGAAPIQWALIRGEKETGVTVFQIDELLDHGPILLQVRHPIREEDTAVTLGESLAVVGSRTLVEAVTAIEKGTARPTVQDERCATEARRLTKTNGVIDWKWSCTEIHNRVRGVQPWPGAITWLGPRILKIFSTKADLGRNEPNLPPGTVASIEPLMGFWVQTGQGQIRIDRLQPEGGHVLNAADFLRGHPIPVGTVFMASANSKSV